METLILYPRTKEQLAALKVVIKALKINFKSEESNYNPEFVEKILQGKEDIKNGKGVKIDTKKEFAKRIPGGLKGIVSIPDDFNDPLDDLKDYT